MPGLPAREGAFNLRPLELRKQRVQYSPQSRESSFGLGSLLDVDEFSLFEFNDRGDIFQ